MKRLGLIGKIFNCWFALAVVLALAGLACAQQKPPDPKAPPAATAEQKAPEKPVAAVPEEPPPLTFNEVQSLRVENWRLRFTAFMREKAEIEATLPKTALWRFDLLRGWQRIPALGPVKKQPDKN